MRLFQVSEYQSGFDWATDALRLGAPEAEIEALTSESGIHPTDFDRGARDALAKYREEMGRSV